mgnify:CR=1 FL=1
MKELELACESFRTLLQEQLKRIENMSAEKVDFSKINAFHMDEYIGLAADAPQGFGNFLRRAIFDKVPFRTVHYLNGTIEPTEACESYTTLLNAHPTDIVFMGIYDS